MTLAGQIEAGSRRRGLRRSQPQGQDLAAVDPSGLAGTAVGKRRRVRPLIEQDEGALAQTEALEIAAQLRETGRDGVGTILWR